MTIETVLIGVGIWLVFMGLFVYFARNIDQGKDPTKPTDQIDAEKYWKSNAGNERRGKGYSGIDSRLAPKRRRND